MRISEFQYQQMVEKCNRNAGRTPPPSESVEKESDLHQQIIDMCKSMGWYYIHSRLDRPTTTAVGVVDFVICTYWDTLFVECKAKGRKPTTEQLAILAFLKKLGRTCGIVYSIEDFTKLIDESLSKHSLSKKCVGATWFDVNTGKEHGLRIEAPDAASGDGTKPQG